MPKIRFDFARLKMKFKVTKRVIQKHLLLQIWRTVDPKVTIEEKWLIGRIQYSPHLQNMKKLVEFKFKAIQIFQKSELVTEFKQVQNFRKVKEL